MDTPWKPVDLEGSGLRGAGNHLCKSDRCGEQLGSWLLWMVQWVICVGGRYNSAPPPPVEGGQGVKSANSLGFGVVKSAQISQY